MRSVRVAAFALAPWFVVAACSSDDSSTTNSASPDAGDAAAPVDAAVDAGTITEDSSVETPVDASDAASSFPSSDASDASDAGPVATEAGPAVCPTADAGGAVHAVKYVFVVALENHDATDIIGNKTDAPYINGTLLPCYANSGNFNDPLPLAIPSEPHYVWMEAGTNAFADATFTTDNDPSAANSTASTLHLSTQLTAASVTWRSYQEDYAAAATGACPIYSSGFYAAKHNPFVFFQDVAGSPPSAGTVACASHFEGTTALATDLAGTGATVAHYNFITPNLCDDMHGAGGCANANTIQAGDTWLAANLPPIIAFANANDGVVFLVWDEGSLTTKIPFLAIGPGVKRGYVGSASYTHSSLVSTNERILGVPKLATVAGATDLADLFQDGALP